MPRSNILGGNKIVRTRIQPSRQPMRSDTCHCRVRYPGGRSTFETTPLSPQAFRRALGLKRIHEELVRSHDTPPLPPNRLVIARYVNDVEKWTLLLITSVTEWSFLSFHRGAGTAMMGTV
jgi:hypothetical protein